MVAEKLYLFAMYSMNVLGVRAGATGPVGQVLTRPLFRQMFSSYRSSYRGAINEVTIEGPLMHIDCKMHLPPSKS